MAKEHGTKHEFVRETTEHLRKSKRENIRIPEENYKDVRLALNDLNLTFQKIYDYCVVGGLVMRRPEMIEFIRKHVDKYRKRSAEERVTRFKGKKEVKFKDTCHNIWVMAYDYDFKAFNDYIIEENIRKSWVFDCLIFDGLLVRDPVFLEMIERNKSMGVNKRKQAVARLSKDPFVSTLTDVESEKLMDLFTKEYDQKKYDQSLYPEHVAKNIDWEESDEDKALDEELNALFQKRRVAHNRINKLLEPVDDVE